MVVGRPEEGTKEDPNAFKTWVGHARISEWIKFYQDGQKHYPPWYRAGQNINDIPKPISKGASKIASSRKWIINGEHGPTIYGAFGWYAAKVTPADPVEGLNYQWIHGTMGWGRDGAAAIELTRGFLVNLFSNPGSAGCTRLENRAIAYLRHLLPVGTDVYRVYAREATREKETVIGNSEVLPLPSYAQQFKKSYLWDYTLLTDGAQQSGGLTADSRTIYIQRIPFARGVNLLEYGSYAVDQYPNAMPLDYSQPAHSGKSGDRYSIDTKKQKGTTASNFHGYFLVDEGRFVDYQHPDQQKTNGAVHVGGLADFRKTVPAFLSTTGSFNIPEVRSVEQDNETTDIH
ncbi:MAG: L,D-transpeptidase, partial [Pseudobdellovibrionaceae bacterium]